VISTYIGSGYPFVLWGSCFWCVCVQSGWCRIVEFIVCGLVVFLVVVH